MEYVNSQILRGYVLRSTGKLIDSERGKDLILFFTFFRKFLSISQTIFAYLVTNK